MNNMESAKLPQGGARRPDALMNAAYRRPSANPLCALRIFIVLAASSAIHAQSTTGIYVSSNNNVGIGTTSPTRALDITSADAASQIKSTGTGNHGLLIIDETGGGGAKSEIRYNDNGSAQFAAGIDPADGDKYKISNNINVGTNDRLVVMPGGNVGIGMTNPANRLVISNGPSTRSQLTISDTNTCSIMLRAGASQQSVLASDVGLSIRTGASWTNADAGGTTAMTLLPNGYVGIGTNSPGAPLDVEAGGLMTTGPMYVNGYAVNSGTTSLVLNNGYNGETYALTAGLPGATESGFSINKLSSYSYGASVQFISTPVLTYNGGNVGIGTNGPQYPLDVNGTIHCSEIITNNYDWADYVFKPAYKLASLSEVEGVIKREGHLPGMPSAADVAAHGLSMGEMQAKLLQKIEELTLHQIEQEKRLNEQANDIEQLEKENAELLERLTK